MPTESPQEPTEQNVKSIQEWLALAHGRSGLEDATGLQRRLATLRSTPLPPEQRLKLLDLLYHHAAAITNRQFPVLHEVTLPVSRRTRQLVRAIQDSLETLAQGFLETLAEDTSHGTPIASLRPAVQCLSWHLTISYLVAAPATTGIWQLLHSAFRTFRELGAETRPPPPGREFHRAHLSIQPVAFSGATRLIYLQRTGIHRPVHQSLR